MSSYVEATIKSYNQRADVYAEYRPLVPPVIKQLDFFISQLKTGKKVLDIGCGHGRDSQYLESKSIDVVGIDLSENLLQLARAHSPNVVFKTMDMRNLDFADATFDGLWVNTSFLHVPKEDAAKTLSGFNRVLKSGGVIFLGIQGHRNELATIQHEISPDQMMVATDDFGNDHPRLFSYYTPEEIEKLLNDAGFETVKVDVRQEEDTKIQWINLFAVKK